MESYEFDRTPLATSRVNPDGGSSEFAGRPIIGHDTRIDGGVYIGSSAREAIVVDFFKDSVLSNLYDKVKLAVTDSSGKVNKDYVLNNVYKAVQSAMATDMQGVADLISERGYGQDKKVTLGVFIKAGIGLCRHQNLAGAALLERFIDEGILSGKVSIDRNTSNEGGHAWCRYTNSQGKVYILDVTRNYIGDMNSSESWDYRRPEEKGSGYDYTAT